MLKIPSIRQIGDVTVYQDDSVWNRFYLVPSRPSIRRDSEERPVFLLAMHHFSEQAREEDPNLPRGAGYMSFDVLFAVDEEARASIERELETFVKDEHRRRRGRGNPPEVELAAPLLSAGKVTMHTTQSEHLTTDRLAEVDASLVAGSAAVFNVDLTSEGANFMHGLLVGEDGEGVSDLSPVQIIYDMKMWARLPPVKITVSADSKRVHETLLTVSETNQDNPCTPNEVESYKENGLSSSSLHESGLVKVEIDKGDAMLPNEVVDELQSFALSLFDKMISERFLVPAESDDEDFEFGDDVPAFHDDADPGWAAMLYTQTNYKGEGVEVQESSSDIGTLPAHKSRIRRVPVAGAPLGMMTFAPQANNVVRSVQVRAGHTLTLYSGKGHTGKTKVLKSSTSSLKMSGGVRSVRISRPPTSRSKVRKTVNTSEMDLRIFIERSQVVEWSVGGQATLETFFSGMSAEEMKRHVVELRGDDFQTLAVDVKAFVDFESSPIAAVEVHVEYPAGAIDGNDPPGNSFTFDRDNFDAERFDPSVIDGQREYRYRYGLIYDDGLRTDLTEWEETTARDLNIAAVDPGKIELEVSGASLDWNVVSAVVVRLSYRHPSGTEGTAEQTFELTEVQPIGRWEKRLRKALQGKIEATFSYRMADEKVMDGEPQSVSASENLLVVRRPQVDTLDVSLVPSGEWEDVVQAVVSLRYDAGGGIIYDETFSITSIDTRFEWKVLLDDAERRQFSYSILITYKNGESITIPEQTRDTDGALEIKVPGSPKNKVTVLPALIDFQATPAVMISFEYNGEGKVLSFTSGQPQTFVATLREDEGREYVYEITWHTADGRQISSGRKRSSDDELFLPRADIPTPGTLEVMIRSFAVDFEVTPYIDVSLSWTDGDVEESGMVTVHKDQIMATWSAEVSDRRNKRFSYAISYNLANGDVVPGPSGTSTSPIVRVKAYEPQ